MVTRSPYENLLGHKSLSTELHGVYSACSSCGKLYRDEYSAISHYRKTHGGGASTFKVNMDNPEERENYFKYYGGKS